jgi:hypothetical protein
MTVQLFCLIFLQKFAVPLPGIPPLSLPMMIMLASSAYMAIRKQLSLSPISLVLYGFFAAAAFVSHALVDASFKIPSFCLLLVITAQQILCWPVDGTTYRRIMSVFLSMMCVSAGIVWLQLAWQIVFGLGHTLNMERMLPHWMMLPGYIYDAPITYGARFVRPNGFFMLEPSYISAMLAIAILVDAAYFRNVKRLFLLTTALVGTVAATGIVLIVFAAPLLILKQPPRVAIWLMGLALAGLLVLVPLGVVGRFTDRLAELNSSQSSGAARLVMPAQELLVVVANPGFLVTGLGAGNEDPATAGNSWAIVKLAVEYGLVAMFAYMALFWAGLSRCPNLPLKVGFFVVFHFTGGYLLNPVMNEAFVLLFSSMQVQWPGHPTDTLQRLGRSQRAASTTMPSWPFGGRHLSLGRVEPSDGRSGNVAGG